MMITTSGAVTGVTLKIWCSGRNCRMEQIAVPATGQCISRTKTVLLSTAILLRDCVSHAKIDDSNNRMV
jgi:hypothetical protein